MKRKAKRDPMPAETAAEVYRRDQSMCQAHAWGLAHRCMGKLEIHHFTNRQMGGGGARAHDLSNLLLVCSWANHWIAEHPRDAEALGLYRRH